MDTLDYALLPLQNAFDFQTHAEPICADPIYVERLHNLRATFSSRKRQTEGSVLAPAFNSEGSKLCGICTCSLTVQVTVRKGQDWAQLDWGDISLLQAAACCAQYILEICINKRKSNFVTLFCSRTFCIMHKDIKILRHYSKQADNCEERLQLAAPAHSETSSLYIQVRSSVAYLVDTITVQYLA